MQKEVVSKEVMQELITKLEEIVNNYCWNLESFTDEDINSFFDGTEEEVTYYKSLIVDSIESTSFLWSSKKIAEKIAQSIIESSKYTNNLIKNMSSIKLKYVTSLPISEISENTIYILKASEGSSKDTLNLYNATDGWISIGDFSISLDDYYNKTEIDSKLDDKANKTEVIANDKIMQTLDSTTNSSDTILSTSGLQTEMDKKANDDEVIKKTDITTIINSSSTDSELPSALATFNLLKKVYPVGSIYINTTDVNPSTIFGFGTWERVAQNMTLWGSSADGQVGTTKSAGLPNITGRIAGVATFSSSYANNTLIATKEANSNLSPGTGANHFSTIALNASKSSPIYGKSTTVQPPALVVNIWKRTA